MKCILIDDEPLARSLLKEYLQNFPAIEIVEECNNGFEGLKAINNHQPDLIFLDIQMPKITGFEMLELVENKPSVIFTTAFDAYALKAFETHAVDYLLKPFSKERFDKAMQKWLSQINLQETIKATQQLVEQINLQPEEKNRIVVKNGSSIRIIPLNEICYLEAYDDYVKIYTQESYYVKKKTMTFYEQTLINSQFVRVHRSYIVNIQEITRIEVFEKDSHIAILKNGTKIPLSKTGYVKLKEVLGW
jgi:two-component system, LytTR family, response regulator